MQNGTPQSKPRLSGARVSGHAAKPQSIVSTWALAGESCGGRQERYSHKDEDPFHGGLQCCPNLAQHRLNDWQHEMVLAKTAMARCPWNSLPRPSNAVMIEGPARGKSAPWCQFVRRTLQAFFAIDLEAPRRIGINRNPADWQTAGFQGNCGVTWGSRPLADRAPR